MSYSTRFWRVYANSVCSLIESIEILILRETVKNIKNIEAPPSQQKMALNIVSYKKYTMP